MRPRQILLLIALVQALCCMAQEAVVMVGHAGVPKADLPTLQRLYTGRVVSIADQTVIPLNLPAGNVARQQFLETVMEQNEEQYTGYWLVRRYVGKGGPPREVPSIDEIIRLIGELPGAVGYLPVSKVPKGANVIFRRGGT